MNRHKATAPAVAPPEYLDTTARAKWAEVWPAVAVATREPAQATLDALAGYCLAFSRWQAAEAKVTELGGVIKSPAGIAVPNPYVAVAKSAAGEMRKWRAELKRR